MAISLWIFSWIARSVATCMRSAELKYSLDDAVPVEVRVPEKTLSPLAGSVASS